MSSEIKSWNNVTLSYSFNALFRQYFLVAVCIFGIAGVCTPPYSATLCLRANQLSSKKLSADKHFAVFSKCTAMKFAFASSSSIASPFAFDGLEILSCLNKPRKIHIIKNTWISMKAHRPASFKKLSKSTDHRKAMLRALTTQIIRHGSVVTTEAKAKAVRKWVDKMITLAKRGGVHALRQALGWIYEKPLVFALFHQAPSRYAERYSGYCRVKKLSETRRGDSARMAQIELV
ncbi:putative 50S ribosomal protein L17 [Cardiosporidium cionae]|uniref:50S ribosomal protein L17 n=1 Tax=Cardiosporidium cionae TaxID=476202 RepID=A0ABQ7JEA2_9APIC|nr:putative 50S ribosomal protein L17 [Cardiosporidium cionae]|eukprot:KAF8822209.1 putative 50S ribosomal protein L17 [Cardiosporidium cionae]